MLACETLRTRMIAVCVLITTTGCLGSKESDVPESGPGPAAREALVEEPAVAPEPVPAEIAEEPAATEMPEVLLAEADGATCLVKIGDTIPAAKLPDLGERTVSLTELMGEKLTVVFFWTVGDTDFSALAATAALEDLEKDVFQRYQAQGVGVIGVNENDQFEVVSKHVKDGGPTFPMVLDPGGAYFAAVATERLPRVYLVDADRKILWFDLEYSETTRSTLQEAIQAALGGLSKK
jgi:peroxiredoxin